MLIIFVSQIKKKQKREKSLRPTAHKTSIPVQKKIYITGGHLQKKNRKKKGIRVIAPLQFALYI